VHDNKVTKNYGVNQFQSKRYPDEDATNPFEGQGGGPFWHFYGTFWDIYGIFWGHLHPTLFRAKEVGHLGTFMGHFWTFMGHYGDFCIQPFSGPRRWDILGLLWKIWDFMGHLGTFMEHFRTFMGHLRLLYPTLSRATEVGHLGTFTSNPFQGQGLGHYRTFMGHLELLHPTLSRATEVGYLGTFRSDTFQGQGENGTFWFFYIQPFRGPRRWDILGLVHSTLFRAKRWDIFWLLWDILGLLHSTLFRAKEVGFFGTFKFNSFQGRGGGTFFWGPLDPTLFRAKVRMGHFGSFTSNPFQG
jgi:hypothetical protein